MRAGFARRGRKTSGEGRTWARTKRGVLLGPEKTENCEIGGAGAPLIRH